MEIEAGELKQKIDRGDNMYILDVRTPQEYKAWKISYDRFKDPPLIPIDQLIFISSDGIGTCPKR